MDLTDLRQAAIDLLEQSSGDLSKLRKHAPQELIHELRVHQVELEMQNEELRRAQLELEESRDKFVNLFDFAPVGYVTLGAADIITEANLTLAKLLGCERGSLVGRSFSTYVVPEDATRLHQHLQDVTTSGQKTSCQLTLKKQDGNLLHVRLDSISVTDNRCSMTIVDLSENTQLARDKQDSDERLRVICHALPIPIAYIDQAEIYRFNNAAHEQWFQVSRQALTGQHVKEFFGREIYQIAKPLIKRALTGHASTFRLDFPSQDSDSPRGGSRSRLVEVHYAPHRDPNDVIVGFYELMFDLSATSLVEEVAAKRAELTLQLEKLSSRQRSVFDLLMRGKSNKAISHELDFGMRTTERERHAILRKLGVESINELLVTFAGLTDSDDLSSVAE